MQEDAGTPAAGGGAEPPALMTLVAAGLDLTEAKHAAEALEAAGELKRKVAAATAVGGGGGAGTGISAAQLSAQMHQAAEQLEREARALAAGEGRAAGSDDAGGYSHPFALRWDVAGTWAGGVAQPHRGGYHPEVVEPPLRWRRWVGLLLLLLGSAWLAGDEARNACFGRARVLAVAAAVRCGRAAAAAQQAVTGRRGGAAALHPGIGGPKGN